MPSRLLKTTALFLTVLYSVVGLTGESLHYLAVALLEDSPGESAAAAGAGEAVVVVYYHAHGPDHHGHFHRHHAARHDTPNDAPPQTVNSKLASEEDASPHLTYGQQFHSDHACPLLTLASALKLSAGGGAVLVLDVEKPPICQPLFDDRLNGTVLFSKSARGPPWLG